MSRSRDIANLLGAGSVILDGAPSALDTLNELAAAIGDDANYASTVTTALNNRVLKTGGDIITVSSGTTVPLTIQNNGTGNSFVVNDEASDTTPFVINSSGNVGIGTTDPTQRLEVYGNTNLISFASNGFATALNFTKSRSTTLNSFSTSLQANDELGYISFNGADGTNSTRSALILSNVDGNVTTGAVPGRLTFFTGASNGSVIERMRINSSGRIQVPAGGVVEAPVSTNAQTGTSYTLVLTDAARVIEMNNASANTLTVPLNSSVAFPIGTVIDIFQIGAGQTTIAAPGGVTINATPGLKLSGQWATATLIKRGTDTWLLTGSLSA